ncbi:hypothetical protein [Nitrosomonas communis]|uniref:hypothetical protein n=1 Tax=Nitrosomonas communis TaxID=44574 RepID=UPI0009434F6B|nr:hypothetical protein [Nitrosomonas communis]
MNKFVILRELRRNGAQRGWRPKQAQGLQDKRVRQKAKTRRFDRKDRNKVDKMIRQDRRPE